MIHKVTMQYYFSDYISVLLTTAFKGLYDVNISSMYLNTTNAHCVYIMYIADVSFMCRCDVF